MSNSVSYGYLRPHPDTININHIKFVINDEEFDQSSKNKPLWDYATPVEINAEINLDRESVLNQCGFDADSSPNEQPALAGLLTWFCTKTKQRGSSAPVAIEGNTCTLRCSIPGELLGGSIQATAHVVLARPGKSRPLAVTATMPGSRLWESDRIEIALEGTASKFAIAPINFKDAGLSPVSAMWKIDISGEMLIPAQAGVRVYLNTHHKLVTRMLESPSSPEAKMWENYLNVEVLNQLLLHTRTLAEDESILDDELFSGSLGESIFVLGQSLFPDQSLSDIAQDPTRIAAVAQAAVFGKEK